LIDSNLSHSSLQILLAWQQKPNVVKSKAIPEEVGALSKERFDVGDFVLLEQYLVKAPDCLPTGFRKEPHTNMFHGGTIFRDASSKYIHVQNQLSLGAGEGGEGPWVVS
jgi:hypothetical protein